MNASNTDNASRIFFIMGDPRLDLIALKIIWEKDFDLWQSITREYPALCSVNMWNDGAMEKAVKRIYRKRRDEISQAAKNFAIWWQPAEASWFDLLESIFAPKEKKAVAYACHIGISPISPRIIEEVSYLASHRLGKQGSCLLHAHETSHFYFFRKIREMELERAVSPRRLWLLSEAIVPLILNDPAAMEIIGSPAPGSYVCKKSLVEKCRPPYDKLRTGKIGIKEFFTLLIGIKIKKKDLNLKFI